MDVEELENDELKYEEDDNSHESLDSEVEEVKGHSVFIKSSK